MYYQCIEHGQITGVYNYEPNVPESVTVIEISDQEYDLVYVKKTHKIDLEKLKVVSLPESVLLQNLTAAQIIKVNKENLRYLKSTDWMILRHLREKTLDQSSSLTEEEYLQLEQKRADAAAAIVK